jgi:hypothetical protein
MIEMIIFNINAILEINNTTARGENLKSRNSDQLVQESISSNLEWSIPPNSFVLKSSICSCIVKDILIVIRCPRVVKTTWHNNLAT